MKTLAHRSSSRRASRGLSLIELMVSLAIGLVLMVAIVSGYLGSAQATRAAEAQGRMNEDAQAALSILSQQVRMAGYNPRQPGYLPATPRNPVFAATDYAVRGCDGTFSNITTAAGIPALTCAASGADSFAVRYEADAANTVRTGTGVGQATDCLGQALTTQTYTVNAWNTGTGAVSSQTFNYWVAENRFYIGTSTAVVNPSLYCKGNVGAAAQPLVENIEDMQILYGTAPATATSTLTVAGYLTASEVLSQPTLAALSDDPARWNKVAAVRICVLVRSEQPAAPDAGSAQYVKCDGTLETAPPDLRLRRAYTTTVVLRNRLTP